MASDKDSLTEKLQRRFKNVDGFGKDDAKELIEEAIDAHKKEPDASDELILIYAQQQAAWQVAINVAHYFKFTDGEESVDKSMIADNYRKIAKDLQEAYDVEKRRLRGNKFKIAQRVDRPYTSPPTGKSRRRWLWRRF